MTTTPKKRRRSSSPSSSRKKLHTEDEKSTTGTKPTKSTDTAYAEFAEMMRGIGVTLNDPTPPDTPVVTIPVVTTPTVTTPVPTAGPKPANPWAGKIKTPAKTWGAAVHEQMHFAPTDTKSYHGVWGTKSLKQVRTWLTTACNSIKRDDKSVVASKPGEKGGWNYLVDMNGTTVGYLSGSKVPPGTQPPAQCIAVYVNKQGYPATAFPCTPDIF